MDSPMYDLIVGNIDGARDPNYPDDTWTMNAVLTRQQVKNLKKPYPALNVPEAFEDVSPEDIRREQQQDVALQKVRT